MNIKSSKYFSYRNNSLFCEEVPVSEIIEKTGSPVYIYSKNFFEDKYDEFSFAFNSLNHRIFYSVKANYNLNVIKCFLNKGGGVDVNSEGELFRAFKAGAKPNDIIFTGVGKTEEEIRSAINNDLLMIKAESEEELYFINHIAGELKKKARVGIRVNPDVNAQTHPYISTGMAENKFGLPQDAVFELFKRKDELNNITFTGIDMHIGSQITSLQPFVDAVGKMSELFFKLRDEEIFLKHFDVGGGIGVQYKDEDVFSIDELTKVLNPLLRKLNCEILFEPGRYLTANGGIIVSRVLYTKTNEFKNFYIIDTGVNDLLRPSFYGAYHHIQPVKLIGGRKDIKADVVGPVCETGDYIAKERTLSHLESGEYIAILSCGSYGMVMSSNYNARRRPPEVMVDGNKFYVIRERETFDHLLYNEKIINDLF